MIISFNLPGQPVAKGRPRFARRGKFIATYTPKKTIDYETQIKNAAIDVMKGEQPSKSPLEIYVRLSFEIPASWSKKKRQDAIDGKIMATKKPDIDNCIKLIFDSCNKICYADDSQIVKAVVFKEYSDKPMISVVITEIEGKGAQ